MDLANLSLDDLLALTGKGLEIHFHENGTVSCITAVPKSSSRTERNARYYERKRLKTTETVLKTSESDTTPSPSASPPNGPSPQVSPSPSSSPSPPLTPLSTSPNPEALLPASVVLIETSRPPSKRRRGPRPCPPFPDFVPAEYHAAFTEWWAYKEQKKDGYVPLGWEKFLRHQINFTPGIVQASINHTMSNGWRGLRTEEIPEPEEVQVLIPEPELDLMALMLETKARNAAKEAELSREPEREPGEGETWS